jgi:hypothetical protein
LQLQLYHPYLIWSGSASDRVLAAKWYELSKNINKEACYWGANKMSIVGFMIGAQVQCLKDQFTHRKMQLHGPKLKRKNSSQFLGTLNILYYY